MTIKKAKRKTIFTIIIVLILAVFSWLGFSFVPICFGKSRILDFVIPTSSGNKIGTPPVSAAQEIIPSPKTVWEKLTSNWHNFSFTSPAPHS